MYSDGSGYGAAAGGEARSIWPLGPSPYADYSTFRTAGEAGGLGNVPAASAPPQVPVPPPRANLPGSPAKSSAAASDAPSSTFTDITDSTPSRPPLDSHLKRSPPVFSPPSSLARARGAEALLSTPAAAACGPSSP
eukprot:1718340-Pyramimonas_sp.AAC.1